MEKLSRAYVLGALTVLGAAGPLALGAANAAAGAKIDPADVLVLNGLLATAHGGIHLYDGAFAAKILSAPVSLALNGFAADYNAHRDALIAIISAGGGTPVPEEASTQPDSTMQEQAFLASALAYERQTSGLYLNAIPALKNRDTTKTVASILGVVTAHIALLAEALRQNPAFPTSFVV